MLQLSDKKRFEANFLINIYSIDLFGIQKNVIYSNSLNNIKN